MREQAATACMNMFVVKIGKLSKIFKIFVGDTYCALVLWKFCRLSDNQYRIVWKIFTRCFMQYKHDYVSVCNT